MPGLCCCVQAFSSCREHGLLSSCGVQASYGDFSRCWAQALVCTGLSSCGQQAQLLWLLGSRARAQELWRTGLVAPRHVGFSRIRDRTHASCTGRLILNHWATGEAPLLALSTRHFDRRNQPMSLLCLSLRPLAPRGSTLEMWLAHMMRWQYFQYIELKEIC